MKKQNKKDIEIIEVGEETSDLNLSGAHSNWGDDIFFEDKKSLDKLKWWGCIFSIVGLIVLLSTIVLIISVNNAVEFIPENVFYPNVFISIIIGINGIFWSFILLILGVYFIKLYDFEVYNKWEEEIIDIKKDRKNSKKIKSKRFK